MVRHRRIAAGLARWEAHRDALAQAAWSDYRAVSVALVAELAELAAQLATLQLRHALGHLADDEVERAFAVLTAEVATVRAELGEARARLDAWTCYGCSRQSGARASG